MVSQYVVGLTLICDDRRLDPSLPPSFANLGLFSPADQEAFSPSQIDPLFAARYESLIELASQIEPSK